MPINNNNGRVFGSGGGTNNNNDHNKSRGFSFGFGSAPPAPAPRSSGGLYGSPVPAPTSSGATAFGAPVPSPAFSGATVFGAPASVPFGAAPLASSLVGVQGSMFSAPAEMYRKYEVGLNILGHFDKIPEDVTFVVDGEDIPAHKTVIAAGSEYFHAMLFGEMQESNNERIPITIGISSQLFRKIVKFLYTGTPGDETSWQEWMDLLPFSDFFQLNRLKLMCEDEITKSMTFDNALNVLQMSRKIQSVDLKRVTLEYIYGNRYNPVLISSIASLQPSDEMNQEILLHFMQRGQAPASAAPLFGLSYASPT